MNKFTQIGLSTVFALGVAFPAAAEFMPFQISAAGDGSNKISVFEYLDFTGNSFIQNTFSSANPTVGDNLTFTDDAALWVRGWDGAGNGNFGTVANPYEITAIFQGEGTGTLGGSIDFTSGILNFYADSSMDYGSTGSNNFGAGNGEWIGTFQVTWGNGNIDPVTALPNGNISIAFEAVSLRGNTWFDEDGNDLVDNPTTLGFVTSNATLITNANPNALEGIVCGLAGFNCPSGNPFNDLPNNFFVSNNGQFRMNTEQVPEPASLALISLGLIGLYGVRRKFS